MPEQRAEQQGVLPAARYIGEELYYWLRKLRSKTAEGIPQIVEVEPPGTEDQVYIRFRGAELALPAGTNVEAIAAVLRSLQQL